MAGYCRITLIGNLGHDPEIRYTPDGLAVTKFSVAVTEKIKNEDRTQWFRITAFGRLGEICGEYLSKGKQVFIEGKLEANEWVDPEGNKKFFLNVVASQLVMLGKKDDYGDTSSAPSSTYTRPQQSPSPAYENTSASPEEPAQTPEYSPSASQTPEIEEDDIPF